MNKKWDDKGTPKEFQKWNEKWAKLAYKALKKGGYLVVFGGTKTYHRMVSGVEDAGFEVKDMIEWMYGMGMPKGYNISKGFEKQNKNELTKKYQGWNTQLKPSHEPIVLAQKPREGTYCNNIEKYGVGGVNIDECRNGITGARNNGRNKDSDIYGDFGSQEKVEYNKGRFPANLLLTHHPDCEYKGEKKVRGSKPRDKRQPIDDKNNYGNNRKSGLGGYTNEDGMETVSDWDCHKDCLIRRMNEQSGVLQSGDCPNGYQGRYSANLYGEYANNQINKETVYADKGGASRYFNQFHFTDEDFFKYTAKASKSERTCDGNVENDHPTVKPIELMKWLVRLVTPEKGIVVDPFCGSGTTLIACYKEGFDYIGIEKDRHNFGIAVERVNYHKNKPIQKSLF